MIQLHSSLLKVTSNIQQDMRCEFVKQQLHDHIIYVSDVFHAVKARAAMVTVGDKPHVIVKDSSTRKR